MWGPVKTITADTVIVATYHYIFVTSQRMHNIENKPNGLQLIMICPCRFIDYVTNIPLWCGMVILGEAMHMAGSIDELAYISF